MPTKFSRLTRLSLVLAVALLLPGCWAHAYTEPGPVYVRREVYPRPYYYRAPPARRGAVIVVPGHRHYERDRRYYRAPSAYPRGHRDHHHHHRDHGGRGDRHERHRH